MSAVKDFPKALKEFARSLSFQVVLAPALLLGFEQVVHGMALLAVIIAMAVGWFIAWMLIWRRRARARLVYVDASQDDPASLLVLVAGNPRTPEQELRNRDLIEKQLTAWRPSKVVALVSPEAQTASEGCALSGAAILRDAVQEVGATLVERLLEPGQIYEPTVIRDVVAGALHRKGGPDRDAVVDMTGGTALASLGLYEAAGEAGVRVSYVDMDGATRLVLDRASDVASR